MGGRAALPVALAATAVAHLVGVSNGFTNWDDPGYLLTNHLTDHPLADGVIGLLTTRSLAYPIPVTVLAYAGERAAFGLSPAAFHLVSLALHLLCVALAACLARRLGGAGPWAAAGAAFLFGVHPVVVEPVAWVVGQKDLLAASLLLTALIVRCGERGNRPGPTALVLALTLLAIGAKPSAVAAVAILPALDLTLGRRLDRSAALLHGGVALAGAGSIALGLVGHGFVGGEAPAAFGPGSLARALWAVSLHARHLVWPDPLLARYFPPGGAPLAAGAAAGAVVLAALVTAAALSWRRGRREVAFSLIALLCAFAPVSGLVPLSRGAADSYLYLPLALGVTAGAAGLDRLAGSTGRTPRGSRAAAVVAVMAAGVALGLVSLRQTGTWDSARTLWLPVARAYPDEPRALMRLADAYLYMGRPAAALAQYSELHARFPDFAASLPSHAASLEALGRPAEAEKLLARAVRLDGSDHYLERYGFFLATHDVAPSDDLAARTSLLVVGKLLVERGKRTTTIARAARLLLGYGEVELAESLRRRRAELDSRRTGESAPRSPL